MKRFVDNVTIQVIEEKLFLALSDILSPISVFDMSSDLVALIAGESQSSRARRDELTKKVEVLEKGFNTCSRFVHLRLDGEMGS